MSGEKERGTLKLTLSFAVSRGQLVAGKLAAGLAAVLAPLGVAWLAPCWCSRCSRTWCWGGPSSPGSRSWPAPPRSTRRFFFAVGLLVSALAKRSSQALVVSLFVWAHRRLRAAERGEPRRRADVAGLVGPVAGVRPDPGVREEPVHRHPARPERSREEPSEPSTASTTARPKTSESGSTGSSPPAAQSAERRRRRRSVTSSPRWPAPACPINDD